MEFFVYSIKVPVFTETWNFGSGIWNFKYFENFRSYGQFAPRWRKYFRQDEKVIALRKENGGQQTRNHRIKGDEYACRRFVWQEEAGKTWITEDYRFSSHFFRCLTWTRDAKSIDCTE